MFISSNAFVFSEKKKLVVLKSILHRAFLACVALGRTAQRILHWQQFKLLFSDIFFFQNIFSYSLNRTSPIEDIFMKVKYRQNYLRCMCISFALVFLVKAT